MAERQIRVTGGYTQARGGSRGATQSKLALFGGPKAVQSDPSDLFTWPIITRA